MNILHPQGPIGAAERTILIDSVAIMLAIVVPTILAILWFAFWYRSSNRRARYTPEWAYSGRVELVVWAIPALTIILLGGVAWIGSHQLDPARPIDGTGPPLKIQVISLDWKWLFIYPAQGVASVNDLVVPAGVPVHFSITSASVMNSFFIPRMGSMIAAMHGMQTDLNLRADRIGTFYGQSVQFSGDGFSDMNFAVHSVPPVQFAAWAAKTRNSGPVLGARAYFQLSRQSQNVKPYTYRAVMPGLFQSLISERLPPAPGPQTGRGGADVSPVTPGGQE